VNAQELQMARISCSGRSMYIYFFLNFLYFSQKYAKFSFCIDTNAHALPAYNPAAVLRTPVTSSHSTCFRMLLWNVYVDVLLFVQDTKPPYQDVLESRFLADDQQAFCFENGEYQYELNFTTMRQLNHSTGTVREVCRRPCFVSALDLKTGSLYVLLFCFFVNAFCRYVEYLSESLTGCSLQP